MFEQLTILNIFKPIKEQPRESTKAAPFKFTDDVVKKVLLRGTGFAGGKRRVVDAYNSGTLDANILKKEYGIGGWTQDYPDGSSGMADHDSRGLKLVRWRDSAEVKLAIQQEHFIPWGSVLPLLVSMIKSGEYTV